MIDTHAHIHDPAFEEDRDAVMARARAAGIETLVAVGTDLQDSERAIEASSLYGVPASVGIHPHEAAAAPEDIAAAFAPLLKAPRVVAIGETGLDFYYDHSPREAQERVLRAQMRVARERNLPLIFHVRDAHEQMFDMLRQEFAAPMRGVVHCFTGNTEQARIYVGEFGLLLGIGGILTFKTAGDLRDAVKAVGIEAVILETDCPYLAPIPMRGKRNEPAFMTYTAERLAQILGILPSIVSETTTNTAKTLFGI